MEVYSLENAIRSFFQSDVSTSRKACDDLARSLLQTDSIVPCAIQGSFSYTVVPAQMTSAIYLGGEGCDSPNPNANIVQFRLQNSKLDIHVAHLAKAIHGEIAARTDYCGNIGTEEATSLSVYVIQRLPGVTYIELGNSCREMDSEKAAKQLTFIEDFARYFATCWLHPQLLKDDERSNLERTMSQKLSLLASNLPRRFTAIVSRAQEELCQLFSPRYPQVLTHGDLCEMNILVSPNMGRITGIIDWAEAVVSPFGLALYGLENLLGFMGPGGWTYFEIRNELEDRFWTQFWACVSDVPGSMTEGVRDIVMIARRVGVLLRYGFVWENGVTERPICEKDKGSIAYLDAFLLKGEPHSVD